MIKNIFITLVLSLLLINNSYSKENFFDEAKKMFDNKKYFKEILFIIQKKQSHICF